MWADECKVLTSINKNECADWHSYVEGVYGHPPIEGFDLTQLLWFYDHAPGLREQPLHRCVPNDVPKSSEDAQVIDINCEAAACNRSTCIDVWPECIIQKKGRFTSLRPHNDIYKDEFIEIIRTNRGEGSNETSEAWFYHAPGSGMFIKNENLEIRAHDRHLTEIIKRLPKFKQANGADLEVYTHVYTGQPSLCSVRYDNGLLRCDRENV